MADFRSVSNSSCSCPQSLFVALKMNTSEKLSKYFKLKNVAMIWFNKRQIEYEPVLDKASRIYGPVVITYTGSSIN